MKNESLLPYLEPLLDDELTASDAAKAIESIGTSDAIALLKGVPAQTECRERGSEIEKAVDLPASKPLGVEVERVTSPEQSESPSDSLPNAPKREIRISITPKSELIGILCIILVGILFLYNLLFGVTFVDGMEAYIESCQLKGNFISRTLDSGFRRNDEQGSYRHIGESRYPEWPLFLLQDSIGRGISQLTENFPSTSRAGKC